MKKWETATVEIQRFQVADVLTISGETAPEISSELTFEDED